jgi:2-keto-4-pentenoate hydratase/2-oxohepta-3-ene-1,7-dioic acid hydratase in catechol pathway
MRLASARIDHATRLMVESPSGALVDVAAADPALAQLGDVGAALRAGESALSLIAAAARHARPEHVVNVDSVELAAPVERPGKLICVGLNYRRHAEESNISVPERPVLFAKYPSAAVGDRSEIPYPSITNELDYEGELGVVIGARAKNVAAADAMSVVGGYIVANDLSARDVQDADPAGQWLRGKSLDGFAPMGPYLVTPDEVGDWRSLRIETRVNGELRQSEGCDDMIFGVEELISFISQDTTLEPGDVILTGTPSGVAYSFEPARWLGSGDVVEVSVTGLGRLTTTIGAMDQGR